MPSGIVFTNFSVRLPSILAVVAADWLNVRSSPNPGARNKVEVLSQNTNVEIIEKVKSTSWVKISYGNGKYGYMNSDYLSPIIEITALSAGNWGDSKWLTNAGRKLYSSEMRFLAPVITYNATFNAKVTFFIKILHPNGELDKGSNAPSGFTYIDSSQVNEGSNQTCVLTAWGNQNVSTYQSGQWTVEVWYNNKRLISEKIIIYP
jgi:uncharacterized protein YgiM (DUF1202 family)